MRRRASVVQTSWLSRLFQLEETSLHEGVDFSRRHLGDHKSFLNDATGAVVYRLQAQQAEDAEQ